jgi:phage terminase large subunit-like protein
MASLSESQRKSLIESLTDDEAEVLLYDWPKWARPNQLPPDGGWDGWLVLAGRGWGKTRVGVEFVRAEVEAGRATRIALIAETAADGRDVIVEGESGLLAVCPPWNKPIYEPSKRRVTWPNGAFAVLYDAREPDQLRGPQHDLALLDELAKYRYAQAVWDNLLPGLRLGSHPRWVATTTPRPTQLIKQLLKDPHVHPTRGKSTENLANLAQTFKHSVIDRYAGTRLGRQELDAEVLEDMPGALWTRRSLDEGRVDKIPPLKRVVVGVDPAASSSENSNETGIIVAGVDANNHGYVIEDWSGRGTPDAWARKAVAAYRKHEADRIVAEKNQGGEMVEHTIHTVDRNVPVTLVHATRGKYVRGEPIAALYEQGRVHHVGSFPDLEDQMVVFTPEQAIDRAEGSPDRVDALVWALTNLFPAMTERVPRKAPAVMPQRPQPQGWLGR